LVIPRLQNETVFKRVSVTVNQPGFYGLSRDTEVNPML